MYKSLCHTPETNLMVYINYISIFKKFKLNTELPYDPTIPPRCTKRKTYGHTKMNTPMLIAALFIIAKKWKPKCPSTSE